MAVIALLLRPLLRLMKRNRIEKIDIAKEIHETKRQQVIEEATRKRKEAINGRGNSTGSGYDYEHAKQDVREELLRKINKNGHN